MIHKSFWLALLALGFLAGAFQVSAQEKKDEQRGGTVIGIVTAKEKGGIAVKGDGEEKARVYVPNWVGGAPAQGGGPDKTMAAIIAKTPIGARVRLEWKFEERPRVVKLEILKANGQDK